MSGLMGLAACRQPQTVQTPEPSRFAKTIFLDKLEEPMELSVAKDGRIFFIERKGRVSVYDPVNQRRTQLGVVPVHSKFNDGLLGLALDPNFEQNHWLYLYYSPLGEVPKQHLSRFALTENGTLDLASEKVLLEVPTQRLECCHSGGSVAFGPDGNLFLSVGDNTNPFGSHGYAAIDEQPGRSPWDAQKSSGNTNDLRGKVLRIHPEPDGRYTIPKGNLFPPGTPGTRPEIYTMGCRNPFRIAVDQRSGVLYWGDVGPDAGLDSTQGPRGYDEINRAARPGFYGWPYFIGDNKPYHDVDFTTQVIGPLFDPKAPVNHSPNNTGLQKLPPATRPLIWYPYAESTEFPDLGKGGRSAMAGPVYHYNEQLSSPVKLPAYYNGALFIYDWMRGWIKAVRLDATGRLEKIEAFPAIPLEKPMDMELGPDGALYVLEYGTNWYSSNDNARLSRIEYNRGNRLPVITAKADSTIGVEPLTVHFSSRGTYDPDSGQALRYAWRFGGSTIGSTEPNPVYTFTRPGEYPVSLTVTDAAGGHRIERLTIRVGNSQPRVSIHTTDNRSFYWPDQKGFAYEVEVHDREDGSLSSGGIKPAQVPVFADYLPEGKDIPGLIAGHQNGTIEKHATGKALMAKSDCKSCHAPDKQSVGPAYLEIARRYRKDQEAVDRLAAKVIRGGGGNWGTNLMSAHPQLSREEATQIVKYVLSLGEEEARPTIAVQGTLPLNQHGNSQGLYLLTAYYTDRGGRGVGPLRQQTMLVLRPARVEAEDCETQSGLEKIRNSENVIAYMSGVRHGAYISYGNIDLRGIDSLRYHLVTRSNTARIEVHLDSVRGPLLSRAQLTSTGGGKQFSDLNAALICPPGVAAGMHTLYFVFLDKPGSEGLLTLDWIEFRRREQPSGSLAMSKSGR